MDLQSGFDDLILEASEWEPEGIDGDLSFVRGGISCLVG